MNKKAAVSIDELIAGLLAIVLLLVIIAVTVPQILPEPVLNTLKKIAQPFLDRLSLGQQPIETADFNAPPETVSSFNTFVEQLSGLPIPESQPCWTTLPKVNLKQDESLSLTFTDTNAPFSSVFVEAKKGDALLTSQEGNLRKLSTNTFPCIVNSYNFIQCRTNQQNCPASLSFFDSIGIAPNFYTLNNKYIVLRYSWGTYHDLNGAPTCFIKTIEDNWYVGDFPGDDETATDFATNSISIQGNILNFINGKRIIQKCEE